MKDTTIIPKGMYCYNLIEGPSEQNNWKGKIKLCPYYKIKEINNAEVPWCDFLNLGGISNNWNENDWKNIRKHYKTEEELDKELPLFLLWDECKECGENYE